MTILFKDDQTLPAHPVRYVRETSVMAGLLAHDFVPLAAFPVSQWHHDDRLARSGSPFTVAGAASAWAPGQTDPEPHRIPSLIHSRNHRPPC